MYPSVGRPRPVGDAIVGLLFPPGESGRIPVTAIVGPKAADIARLITDWGSQHGHCGLALRDEVCVKGKGIRPHHIGNAGQRRGILLHPLMESCAFEIDDEETLREGLPFDRCRVAVITGLSEVQSEGQITFGEQSVHRVLPASLTSDGVLVVNADDAAALALATQFEGHHLCYSRTPDQVEQAAREGAPAVWKKGADLVFHNGKREVGCIPALPLLDAEVLLPAVSAAWAAGASLEELQQALNYPGSTAAAG
jgi:cyanophycin synthetase